MYLLFMYLVFSYGGVVVLVSILLHRQTMMIEQYLLISILCGGEDRGENRE